MKLEDLAREAGGIDTEAGGGRWCWRFSDAELTRFAALVRAQALDEAAAVCEGRSGTMSMFVSSNAWRDHDRAIKGCAAAIRALKEST
jgi:hypothetical protein